MRDDQIGRGLRALRHRRGLRQSDLSRASGVARSVIADVEAGRIGRHSVDAVRRSAEAAGGWVRIDLMLAGDDVRRLLDADHAQLQAGWKSWLERHRWLVDAELTFNHFGERGSIDLFAWHPGALVLMVIEIKTVIADVQALLAGVDRKQRLARVIARDRGLHPTAIVPALILAEGSTARRRVTQHASLFERLSLRGRAAMAWMTQPGSGEAPAGVLCVTKLSGARSGDRRRAGRQRIRRPTGK